MNSFFEKVIPDKIRSNRNCYTNIVGIENKLTRFQIHSETELACKYNATLYKTQNPELLVKYE